MNFAIISSLDFKKEIKYDVKNFANKESYKGNHDVIFIYENELIKIGFSDLNESNISCEFEVVPEDAVKIINAFISILVRPSVIGTDPLDVERVMTDTENGIYTYINGHSYVEYEIIAEKLLSKVSDFSEKNKMFLFGIGDYSLFYFGQIADYICDKLKNKIGTSVINFVYDSNMGEDIELYLFAMNVRR